MKNSKLRSVTFTYTNTTNELKRVSCFETFNVNQEGIEFRISDNFNVDSARKYFYEYPCVVSKFRFMSSNLNSMKGYSFENISTFLQKEPISVSSILLDIPDGQYQAGILDREYYYVLGSITDDLEFDLLPNTEISIAMFFSEIYNIRSEDTISALTEKCHKLNENISVERV
jgi:hypothetical protein